MVYNIKAPKRKSETGEPSDRTLTVSDTFWNLMFKLIFLIFSVILRGVHSRYLALQLYKKFN